MLLIRHSPVTRDPAVESAQWPLSPLGRRLAAGLVEPIRPWAPTRMLTSVEPKAAETGQMIATALKIPCQTAPDLHEHDRHAMGYLDSHAAFEAQVIRFFNEPDSLLMGNETATAALTRFSRAIAAAQARYPTDTLAIASHGTVLALFLAAHNPTLDPIPFWRTLPMPCALLVDPATYQLHQLLTPTPATT